MRHVDRTNDGERRVPAGPPRRAGDGWILGYPDGAWYRVSIREQVEVEGDPIDAMVSEITFLRLNGPVTSVVMAATGVHPLHAVGLVGAEGVVGVCAASGGGKSTLGSLWAGRGGRVLGDDLLAVTDTGMVRALPGALRVQPASAPDGWAGSFTLADGRMWYQLPAPEHDLPLRTLVWLRRGDSTAMAPLTGAARLAAVAAADLGASFDPPAGADTGGAILELAARVPVWELTVPTGLTALRDGWPRVATWLADLCA